MKKIKGEQVIIGIGWAALIGAIAAHIMGNDPMFVICAVIQIGVAVFEAANINARR